MRRLLPALTAAGCALGCAGGELPPNLLLVSVDTLRADRLVCYGGAAGPGLCGLFDAGTRYRWAFSSASVTAPAIASLLTSRYPADHGVAQVMRSRLPDAAVTVAERLRASGYATAAFVSNPVLDRARNFGQGFEVYDDQMTRRERNRPRLRERDAAATSDAALGWARFAAREPWFLWVHYQDPHGPYEPPGAAPGRDPPGAPRLPVLGDPSGRSGIPDYQALPGLFTAPAYEARYLAEVRFLDRHFVRLVRALDALGRPPTVLLTADHGEAFGEDDYWFAHGHSLGLDQIRVPLLLRDPRATEPRVVEAPVSLVDVAPTLLALAGVESPDAFQGRVLPGVATGRSGAAAEQRTLFADHPHRSAVIRGRRYHARDRAPATRGGPPRDGDPPPLPAREARLGPHDALPRYRSPSRDESAPMAAPIPFR